MAGLLVGLRPVRLEEGQAMNYETGFWVLWFVTLARFVYDYFEGYVKRGKR